MNTKNASTPHPPRPAGFADLGFGAAILALVVVVLVVYGDNLLDVIDGLTGFSFGGLLMLALGAGAILIAVIMPALDAEDAAAVHAASDGGPRLHGTARQNRALEILHGEKLRLLRAIRDLDFDYDMGKLTDSIYTEQRVALIERAVAILHRINGLEAEIRAQQDRIAAALQAYRAQH